MRLNLIVTIIYTLTLSLNTASAEQILCSTSNGQKKCYDSQGQLVEKKQPTTALPRQSTNISIRRGNTPANSSGQSINIVNGQLQQCLDKSQHNCFVEAPGQDLEHE